MVHLHSGPSVLCPDCLLPSAPYGRTGTGLFRREPSNSTGGTLTHERNHLHGLLRHILTLPPIEGRSERGVHAASSFPRRQATRFAHAARTLKRPEGRAPGAVSRCAPAPGICHEMSRGAAGLEVTPSFPDPAGCSDAGFSVCTCSNGRSCPAVLTKEVAKLY